VNVLILGGAGIVATYLVETAPEDFTVTLAYRNRRPAVDSKIRLCHADLISRGQLAEVLKDVEPEVLINAAGLSSVDECEHRPADAHTDNVVATVHVLAAIRGTATKLVQLSSNAVYSGREPPYAEDSPRRPINVYGRTKRASENEVLKEGGCLIARLGPVFGWNRIWTRINTLTWMISSLAADQPMGLREDLLNTPISAEFAGRALWRAIQCDITGQLNIAGRETVTWYEFGCAVAAEFGFASKLLKRAWDDRRTGQTPRPRDTSFTTTALADALGMISPTLREELERMHLARLASDEPLVPGRLNEHSNEAGNDKKRVSRSGLHVT
jgi:dTDP-4-dehydrorhamnose reductase